MLTKPTPEYVSERLIDFDAEPRNREPDHAVALVFGQWPHNQRMEEVLAKVALLNNLYSTNIYGVHALAQHIVDLRIDGLLANGDPLLVEKIADVTLADKRFFFLSFASKYCSWHQPQQYQIYDSFVDELLWQYQKVFEFTRFKRKDLRSYPRFVQIVDGLVEHFGLNSFSRKELDKFLWLEGRALSGVDA